MTPTQRVASAAITGLLTALGVSACRSDGVDRPLRANVPNAAEPGSTESEAPASGGKMSCSAEMMGSAAPREGGKMSCAPGRCGANMSSAPSAAPSTSAAPPAPAPTDPHQHHHPASTPSSAPTVAPSSAPKASEIELPGTSAPAVSAAATATAETMACGGKMGCSPAMMGGK